MKRLRLIILTGLCLLPIILGCGAVNKQAEAVEKAIAECSDFYIEALDINSQVRNQLRNASGYEDTQRCVLDTGIPNYTLADINNIPYEPPSVDFENPDVETYLAALQDALMKNMDHAAIIAMPEGSVNMQIVFDLSLENKEWTARIAQESLSSLQRATGDMMKKKLAELAIMPRGFDYVRIAQQKNALFRELLDSEDYIPQITIIGIDGLDSDLFQLSIKYPDPELVYDALSDLYIDSVQERVFGSAVCSLDLGLYKAITTQISKKAGKINVTLDTDGHSTVADAAEFTDEFENARIRAEKKSEDIVNERWSIPEQNFPTANTILAGKSTGRSQFRFRLDNGAVDTLIRLYQIESDTSEEGTLVAAFYVLADGKEFHCMVPPGKYKVTVAWGDRWYGLEYLFGPKGHYMVFEEVNNIPRNYSMTYKIDRPWNTFYDVIDCDYDIDIAS